MNLQTLLSRTDEIGDCLIWNGTISGTGYPIVHTADGCKLVRRLVFTLSGGVLKPRQPVVSTCADKRCIDPAHLRASTTAKVAQAAAKRGAYSTRARAAKIAAARRNGGAKLTEALAAEIRLSTESGPVLGARYGVNRSLISAIRSGKVWRDYSSPFAGLVRGAA